MSFAVDKAGKQIVLNLNGQGLHLWDIETKTLVKRFRGVVQGHYTIQSCFGGIGDNFIASGSEGMDSIFFITLLILYNTVSVFTAEVLSADKQDRTRS